MPRLIEYLSVGFCSGYGDGDYKVSMAVCDLDAKQYNELRATCVAALGVMEEHWKAAQVKKMPQAQQEIVPREKP